ncbi:FimV/HubP family polar landmark protein [Pseudomonas sp.]|uniref:FimV/HubP family polar landmark protein n=1 Tax=Pseudomonas sp. TaxID=306 RepID=UPI002730AA58|nr:FimV/HubP family polar landmark protein [Pseudomonas sp.]MDP2245525.1 FimV/HubP family polar landmark protein [Pseudomonas sp.]
MSRVRQLLIGLASSSAFYSGVVPALGLGEITLHSALNQPLDAEIELLEVADLTSSDLLVRLASADVFSRSGVDRLFFLNDLRFTPLLRGGNSVIRVVSSQPVREPYLNFIVEVARPNGALLREYTLLLDPPNSSAFRTVAAAPEVQASPERAQASSTSTSTSTSTPAPAAPRVMPVADAGAQYQVVSGDSLWKIAADLRAAGSQASQQALMRDIHALNPQAFTRGDINRLQAGGDLLLPDTAQAGSAPIMRVTADTDVSAELQAQAPGEPPADPQVEQVALMQQRLDQELLSQAEENLKLQQSVIDLQTQVQQLQAQMSGRDQQLAELQAQLVERSVVEQSPPAPVVAEPAVGVPNESGETPGRNWFSIVLAALALLLVGLLGLFWRRRRAPSPENPQAVSAEPLVIAPEPITPPLRSVPLAARATPASAAANNPVDALEGANIYIAYGRFSEAAVILRKALDVQPERSDIRFRLLEVLAQQGDARAFAEEEAVLRASGFTAARIDQLKARHPRLLDAPAAAETLDDAALVLDESQLQAPAHAADEALEDDFQLNLDDLSLDADWDLVSPFPTSMRKKSTDATSDGFEGDDVAVGFEPTSNRDARSPFAQSMLVEEATADDWLQENLGEDFLAQPLIEDSPLLHDFEQLAGNHDNLAKLNLALAYIEQGSLESACNILNEVISDGDDEQRQEARELLAKIA